MLKEKFMYPRITIQSGISAGSTYRIERRVARIGSDPQSDVCLPTTDIPSHALTLEFRDESCLVYNRCRSQVVIGAQIVAPEQSAVWPETDILQLDGGIELLLDFDDEPVTPSMIDYDVDEAVEADDSDRGESGDLPVATAAKNSSKTVVQLAVTALCIVGCVLLLLRDQNRSKPTVQISLQEVVDANVGDSTQNHQLVQRVQFAESQRVRGRAKAATKEFQFIRDDLVGSQAESGGEAAEFQSKVLMFVQSRLEK